MSEEIEDRIKELELELDVVKGQLEASRTLNKVLDAEVKDVSERFGKAIDGVEQVFGTAIDYKADQDGIVFIGDNTPETLAQEMVLHRKNLEWEVRELRKLCKEASHLTCQFYEKRWQDWMKQWNQIKDVSYANAKSR